MTKASHPASFDSREAHASPASSTPADSATPSNRSDQAKREPNSWRSAFPLLGVLSSLVIVEIVTGALLMFYYSPAVQTAWGSVWYIETQTDAGWLIRGVHRLASDALVIAGALSIVVALVIRAYRPPRHAVWYASIAVFLLAMALAISGRTLPWDQHAYWGTIVRTNIVARAPIVGETLRSLILGGSEPGQFTLTRFFTSHTLILPAILGLLLWTVRRGRQRFALYVDLQKSERAASRDIARSALVKLCVVAVLVFAAWLLHERPVWATLSAPADPQSVDYPARPEWFNLFLYQWLKGFQGPTAEVVGLFVVPGLILAMIVALPTVTHRASARVAHAAAWALCGGVGLAIVVLTVAAVKSDYRGDRSRVYFFQSRLQGGEALSEFDAADRSAYEFQMQWVRAEREARRACELAGNGVPVGGPLELLRHDPQTRGPRLFAEHCAACHRFAGHDGLGGIPTSAATSSDLAGFGSSQWIRRLLEDPMSELHFGLMKTPDGVPAHTRMAKWIAEQNDDAESDSARRALASDFDAVAAYLSTESGRESVVEYCDTAFVERGRSVFFDRCNECHNYNGERSGTLHAPEMKGYASVEWLERLIADPGHESLYRREGKEPARMPAFSDRLSPTERSLIARWLHDAKP